MSNKILFRCSKLGDLMTNSRSKSDMGETCKTYIEQQWLQDTFGYREEVVTDEMMKGNLCEQDSMALVQKVIGGEFRVKNVNRFQNDYIEGVPDNILKADMVEDIKTSSTLRTFFNAELSKGYWWQLQGYMWLTGKTNARLIYCLVPTPEAQIIEAKKRYYFRFDCDENNPDYIRICEQIDHNNNVILSIPPKSRIKVFEFGFDPEAIEQLKFRVEQAREYYATLKLPEYQRNSN